MLEIPIRCICGTNSLPAQPNSPGAVRDNRGHWWIPGKCWIVVLDYPPYRVVRIPKSAVLTEIHVGDRGILIEAEVWSEYSQWGQEARLIERETYQFDMRAEWANPAG